MDNMTYETRLYVGINFDELPFFFLILVSELLALFDCEY